MKKLKKQLIMGGICFMFLGVAVAEDNSSLVLRKIMQSMQVNIQQIDTAIQAKNWQEVTQKALLIADHPAPPLMEKIRILAYMNVDMLQFKQLDAQTHDMARILADLAEQKQAQASELEFTFERLKSSCTACHQVFRKDFQMYFYGEPSAL